MVNVLTTDEREGANVELLTTSSGPIAAVVQSINDVLPQVQLHDLTFNPVGLWQFQGNGLDSSGNGFNLTQVAGDERYTEIFPGVLASMVFGPTAKWRQSVAGTALEIRGDITIEMFLKMRSLISGNIVSYDTNGEAEADNFLYAISMSPAPTFTAWASEHGAGIDDVFNNGLLLPPLMQPVHFAARRQADRVQFFMNGLPWGALSPVLPTPTGGQNSVLCLGWIANPTADFDIASLKICASALSDADILSEFNRTLGPFYGHG